MSPTTEKKIKRFAYSIHFTPKGEPTIVFDIRLQHQGAKVGMTPTDTTELWLTYAEMPHVIDHLMDEQTWETHRKAIVELLALHFSHHSK